jgi:hypothetical protein
MYPLQQLDTAMAQDFLAGCFYPYAPVGSVMSVFNYWLAAVASYVVSFTFN